MKSLFFVVFLFFSAQSLFSSETLEIKDYVISYSAACVTDFQSLDCWGLESAWNYGRVEDRRPARITDIPKDLVKIDSIVSGDHNLFFCAQRSQLETNKQSWVECWGGENGFKNIPAPQFRQERPESIFAVGAYVCAELQKSWKCWSRSTEASFSKKDVIRVLPMGDYGSEVVCTQGRNTRTINCGHRGSVSWDFDEDNIVWGDKLNFCVYTSEKMQCFKFDLYTSSWNAYFVNLSSRKILIAKKDCILFTDNTVSCSNDFYENVSYTKRYKKIDSYQKKLGRSLSLLIDNKIELAYAPARLGSAGKIPYRYNHRAHVNKLAFECNKSKYGAAVAYFNPHPEEYGKCIQVELKDPSTGKDLGFIAKISCKKESGRYIYYSKSLNLNHADGRFVDFSFPEQGYGRSDHSTIRHTDGSILCRSYLKEHKADFYYSSSGDLEGYR